MGNIFWNLNLLGSGLFFFGYAYERKSEEKKVSVHTRAMAGLIPCINIFPEDVGFFTRAFCMFWRQKGGGVGAGCWCAEGCCS
jgi:hypothetical protein